MNIEDKYLVVVTTKDGLERNILVDKNSTMTTSELVEFIRKEACRYFIDQDSIVSFTTHLKMPMVAEYVEPRSTFNHLHSSARPKRDVLPSYLDEDDDEFDEPEIVFDWALNLDENDPSSHREFCELIQVLLNNRSFPEIAKMLDESEFVSVINELGLHADKLWHNYETKLFIDESEKRLIKTIVDWVVAKNAEADDE